MAFSLTADQISVRGVKSSNIAGSNAKPRQFVYQPSVSQKRIETYDSEGYNVLGVPIVQFKDYKLNVGWSLFSPSLAALATADPEVYYSATVSFATTDNGTLQFSANNLVIDGSSVSLDPLSDSASIGFIIMGTVTFE